MSSVFSFCHYANHKWSKNVHTEPLRNYYDANPAVSVCLPYTKWIWWEEVHTISEQCSWNKTYFSRYCTGKCLICFTWVTRTQCNFHCQSEAIADSHHKENLRLRSNVCQFLHVTLDASAFLTAAEMLEAHHSPEQHAEHSAGFNETAINVLIKINSQSERA